MAKGVKVTRGDLYRKAQRLAERTGRPVELGAWSPGDGWTRYSIDIDGGASRLGNLMTADAAYDSLTLVLSVLAEVDRRKVSPTA